MLNESQYSRLSHWRITQHTVAPNTDQANKDLSRLAQQISVVLPEPK